MKRLLFLIALLLVGCINNYYVTPSPTAGPSPTPYQDTAPEASLTAVSTSGVATQEPGPTITVPTTTPVPTATPTPTAIPGPVENLLQCWGFECGWQYDTRHPTGGLKVPLGWTAFWQVSVPAKWETSPPSDRFCGGFIPAVETEAHRTHVHEGMFSGRVIEDGDNCPAGLYQTIKATPGASYVFSGYVFNWSTNHAQVDTPSTSYIRSFVGIDPTGGDNWQAASIVWSKEESARDAFAYLEVEARAQGDHITVFLLSIPNFAVARSDSFWDDLSVVQSAGPSIIEVPPHVDAGRKDLLGYYTPANRLNIRRAPVTDPANVWGTLSGGYPQRVVAMITTGSGDLWLCITDDCSLVVAWWVGKSEYGTLILDSK